MRIDFSDVIPPGFTSREHNLLLFQLNLIQLITYISMMHTWTVIIFDSSIIL